MKKWNYCFMPQNYDQKTVVPYLKYKGFAVNEMYVYPIEIKEFLCFSADPAHLKEATTSLGFDALHLPKT